MTQPPTLRGAARVLATEGGLGDKPVVAPSDGERARAIAAIAAAMQAKARRRAQVRFGAFALAAAAAVALWIGVGRRDHAPPAPVASGPASTIPATSVAGIVAVPMGGAVTPIRAGRPGTPLSGPATLAAGDRLVAAQGAFASLSLPTGTRLELKGGGDLSIVEQGSASIFSLAAGSVRADVHKLAQGERFVVRTLDAEVEVRGTSFQVSTVDPDPGCATRTRLTVFEGVVVVRSAAKEVAVRAGEHWPLDCTPPSVGSAAPSASVAALAPAVGKTDVQKAPAVASSTIAPPTPSVLAAQNALYSEALAAKNKGELATAVERFDSYLLLYPGSALAESAQGERMRALYKLDRARGVAAAKAYLAAYPKGSARADAQTIVDDNP